MRADPMLVDDLNGFLKKHGGCQFTERRDYDPACFLLTYTGEKEQGPIQTKDLPMTPEQLAYLETLK